MPYHPEQHHRQSIRLRDYDYSQNGAYFVTICTHQRQCSLGTVSEAEVQLSPYGEIAERYWLKLAEHYSIVLDAYIVMPNHIHGIIIIEENTQPLTAMIRSFKTFSAKAINKRRGMKGVPVWQTTFYDHIIRNEASLQRIRDYIMANPARWTEDDYYLEDQV